MFEEDMRWFEDKKRAIGSNEFVRELLLRYIRSTHNNLTYQQLTMHEMKNTIKSSNMV